MSEQKNHGEDGRLNSFFEAARANAPKPSDDLLARIDAAARELGTAPVPGLARPAPARRGILAALGGWPVLAGLATAAIAGVWIGYSEPSIAGLGSLDAADGFDIGGLLPGYLAADDWSS